MSFLPDEQMMPPHPKRAPHCGVCFGVAAGGLVPNPIPPSPARILFIEEVSLCIGKTATTIRTCSTNEKYFHLIPRPFKLPNSRRLMWREEDVQNWINQATPVGQVQRRRGAPTKAERVARAGGVK